MKRPYETRYFDRVNGSARPTRGFPKAEAGSIDGAARAVARGYVRKVQCIDRENGDRVVWTVQAGPKVRGINIIPTVVTRGDSDDKPSRRKA